MCVHDAEHVFKVISYVKYEFKFSLVLKFLTGWWSVVGGRLVGGWCIWSVVGWSVVGLW